MLKFINAVRKFLGLPPVLRWQEEEISVAERWLILQDSLLEKQLAARDAMGEQWVGHPSRRAAKKGAPMALYRPARPWSDEELADMKPGTTVSWTPTLISQDGAITAEFEPPTLYNTRQAG
jgi:hypothetical protein